MKVTTAMRCAVEHSENAAQIEKTLLKFMANMKKVTFIDGSQILIRSENTCTNETVYYVEIVDGK